MTENQKKLLRILEEMFQFDQAELDFGIYRIMAMKRDEIKKFLNEDLMAQITEDLKLLLNTSGGNQLDAINKEIENARTMNVSETIKTAMIAELEEKKKAFKAEGNIADVEGDIYSHLTNFFERYYDEGDFISQRRYKDGAYAIPYEGEEVKLHWANADQYYIKTSEYFKNYTFKTAYGKSVHFKIIEAETDKDNNKSNEKRFFQLYTEKPFETTDDELVIYFEYKNGGKKNQSDCITEVISAFTNEFSSNPDYSSLLTIKEGKSLLERQLLRYTARNTFDYFIHKDLGKFLNRELDFYIKNDVIFLDDIDEQNDAKTKKYLVKAKVIRKIARKIIAFLAQIEDFQKKLWLKKKFVVETNYCITLDRVPKKLYDEIIKNTAQIKEWKKLFAIHEIEEKIGIVGYSEPLKKEFLEQNKFLVLDTAFFADEFKEKLIDSIDDLDEKLDGLMIHGENFQSLNLIRDRYEGQVNGIYIDPPYNTDGMEILYKNGYKDSSWIALMNDRLIANKPLLEKNGVVCVLIDDAEYSNLAKLMESTFPDCSIRPVIIEYNHRGRVKSNFAYTHEYAVWAIKSGKDLITREREISDDIRRNLRRTGTDSTRQSSPSMFYGIEVNKETLEIIGVTEALALNESIPEHKSKLTEMIWPIDDAGIERRWYYGKDRIMDDVKEGTVWAKRISGKIQVHYHQDGKPKYRKTLWSGPLMDSSTYGSELLNDFFGLGFNSFSFPKSINAVDKCLQSMTYNPSALFLDYFAGSGTTGHAVINFNREDDGNRKFILIEMGEYFDTVTKPRIEKVIYSGDDGNTPAWKDGKPVSRKGSSHAFKYIRIESYEDTLNNLKIETKQISLPTDVKEQYLINYMFSEETKGSDSLININKFDKPFDYSMSITRKLESTVRKIDLVETFNYLIGIRVERSYAMQKFDADFKEGEYGSISATLKDGSTYKIKMIEGRTLSGDSVLIIWRELTGDKVKDNAVLDSFFAKKKISTTDFEYKKIYVNGDNNLPNMRAENESWKVILIEEEMKKRMFENAN